MGSIKWIAKNDYVFLKMIDDICDKLERTSDDIKFYIPKNKDTTGWG